MRGALQEDLKTTGIIVAVIVVVGVIGGTFYAFYADYQRSEQLKLGAVQDCPNDRHRMNCAMRVEELHEDCFEQAKAQGGLNVRTYRQCVRVPFNYGPAPDLNDVLDSIVPGQKKR